MTFWNQEELGIHLEPGMDEVSLALVADAWSRTYRSRTTTMSTSLDSVATRNGIRVLPDRATADQVNARPVSTFPRRPPAEALDQTLEAITSRYGKKTADMVAMQLEYPR
jgi:hypothetical protein